MERLRRSARSYDTEYCQLFKRDFQPWITSSSMITALGLFLPKLALLSAVHVSTLPVVAGLCAPTLGERSQSTTKSLSLSVQFRLACVIALVTGLLARAIVYRSA